MVDPAPTPGAALEIARWEAILATAFDAIISIDAHGRIVLFNQAAESIFGYPAAAMMGQPIEVLMPPPYCDEHVEYVRRYEETGIPRAIGRIRKVEARRKSGDVFPIELSVSRAQVGDTILYSAIIRDVSVQTRLEAELRAYGRRAAALARLGLVALDENVPRLCEEACTISRDALEVDLAVVLLAGPDGALVIRGARGSRHPVGARIVVPALPLEPRATVPDALREPRLVAGLSVPIGGARRPLGLLVLGAWQPFAITPDTLDFARTASNVLADAIGREEAEREHDRLVREGRQRERLADIGTLTAKVLHDLGNPLAGLSMTAQSILRRIERTPEDTLATVRPIVERLVTTMQRLDTLLSEFKGFAREHDLEVRDVLLHPFLTTALGVWEPEASRREVTIELSCPQDVVVRGDPDQLHRVVDNLLKNALEAVGHGPGEITVAVENRAPDRTAIVVSDTGPGLPSDIDIFALFATTKSDGTGLGLPTCRQIVEAHGGHIAAASRSPRGAVVTVELPRSPRT